MMGSQTAKRPANKGICKFCEKSFIKGSMNRHLQACKERAAYLENLAKKEPEVQKIFQIAIEDKYIPQYWLQVEMPADEELDTLDMFLRDFWLECCGHLSAFTLPNKELLRNPLKKPESAAEWEANTGEELPAKYHDPAMWDSPEVQFTLDRLFASLQRELKNLSFTFSPEGRYYDDMEPWLPPISQAAEQTDEDTSEIKEEEEEEEEEEDLRLETLLEVGDMFTYEYDFGTSTDLKLKVVGEREGGFPSDVGVLVVAQNEAPEVLCQVCGKKRAVKICNYCEYEGKGWLCSDCAKKHKKNSDCGLSEEELLPVVNSPRAGVCGYTGSGEDYEDDEDYDEEEEE
jgi:hypothetical protein